MTTKNIAKDIKNNWSEIKSNVKRHWKKLSAKDLKEIEGSYSQLVKKVEDVYDLSKEEATAKVQAYIVKLGLTEASDETIENMQTSLTEKAKIAKEKFEKSILESIGNIRDKTENAQEDIADYVKTNPMKSVGLAILAGLVTGKLWSLEK